MNQDAKPEKKSKMSEFHSPSWGHVSNDLTPSYTSHPKDNHLLIS